MSVKLFDKIPVSNYNYCDFLQQITIPKEIEMST